MKILWNPLHNWGKQPKLWIIKGNLKLYQIDLGACLRITSWVVFLVILRMRWGCLWKWLIQRILMKPLVWLKFKNSTWWAAGSFRGILHLNYLGLQFLDQDLMSRWTRSLSIPCRGCHQHRWKREGRKAFALTMMRSFNLGITISLLNSSC